MATTWIPEDNGNTGRMIWADNETIYSDSEDYYADGSDVYDKEVPPT